MHDVIYRMLDIFITKIQCCGSGIIYLGISHSGKTLRTGRVTVYTVKNRAERETPPPWGQKNREKKEKIYSVSGSSFEFSKFRIRKLIRKIRRNRLFTFIFLYLCNCEARIVSTTYSLYIDVLWIRKSSTAEAMYLSLEHKMGWFSLNKKRTLV